VIELLLASVVALGVSATYWLLNRKAPHALPDAVKPSYVPEAPEGSAPRYGSRRWARALYYNSLIDLEELNKFYALHPEDLSDADR